MQVRAHNGGANYSWLAGAGRRQPYWTAVKDLDPSVLLLSWTYSTRYTTLRPQYSPIEPAFPV